MKKIVFAAIIAVCLSSCVESSKIILAEDIDALEGAVMRQDDERIACLRMEIAAIWMSLYDEDVSSLSDDEFCDLIVK